MAGKKEGEGKDKRGMQEEARRVEEQKGVIRTMSARGVDVSEVFSPMRILIAREIPVKSNVMNGVL